MVQRNQSQPTQVPHHQPGRDRNRHVGQRRHTGRAGVRRQRRGYFCRAGGGGAGAGTCRAGFHRADGPAGPGRRSAGQPPRAGQRQHRRPGQRREPGGNPGGTHGQRGEGLRAGLRESRGSHGFGRDGLGPVRRGLSGRAGQALWGTAQPSAGHRGLRRAVAGLRRLGKGLSDRRDPARAGRTAGGAGQRRLRRGAPGLRRLGKGLPGRRHRRWGCREVGAAGQRRLRRGAPGLRRLGKGLPGRRHAAPATNSRRRP